MNIPTSDPLLAEIGLPLNAPDSSIIKHRLRQQVITVASMYLGYAMFMVLRMIPTVAGAAIREDPSMGMDLEVWGKILAIGTWGAVVGKFICGYAADRFGGKLTFTVGLLTASIFVGVFGFVSDVRLFGAAFFLALMAKSAGWPSMARIIINWFQPNQYGRVWGILSTSSRLGTLAATFCLGSLLAWMSWRGMLWIAAGLCIVTAIVFAFLLKDRPDATTTSADVTGHESKTSPSVPHPLNGTTVFEAIPCILRSGQFWLITGSLMGLGILWDFLLMVPMFLQDTLRLSAADASRAASAFPFGSLISVLIGGYVFDKLSRGTTAWVMGLLLTIATGCLFTFLMMPHFELTAGSLIWLSLGLLFVFGLCVSPCYYIPMSVFSIEFGGPHSGFLIALLDALSFAATAVFYYYGGGLAEQSWSLFLTVLLAVSVWSALTTYIFMVGESRKQGRQGFT
jgi:OPA family sugar phosphate sensor protein UhpC-like MFS transporter